MSGIQQLKAEISELKAELEKKQNLLKILENEQPETTVLNMCGLTNDDISRYSRQIILPQVSVKGQIALRDASVLIVGVGGLGTQNELVNNFRNLNA